MTNIFSSFSARTLMVIFIIWSFSFSSIKRWENYNLIQWDIFQYYSYLPALFIEHDLSYDFMKTVEPDSHWRQLWFYNNEDGTKSMKMTMGLSFLYLPFFLLAHLLAGWLGYTQDGFSVPYQVLLALSCIVYAFIGLCILRKVLLKYFNEHITAITLAVIVFGTNLWSGTVFEPGLSHPYLFMLIAIFLYFTIKWFEQPKYKTIIVAGFTAGLITLIRPTDILYLLIPILFGVTSWKGFTKRLKLFWQNKIQIMVFAVCVFMVFIPQMIHWKYISGHWLLYSYGVERFYFLKPHLLSGLFSYRKGWFIYTPTMLVAIAGIFLLKKYAKDFFWLILIFLPLNVWIILSWWCWWYGGCFGMRPMIESYALLIFPLAACIQFIWEKRILVLKVAFAFLVAGFVGLNLFQSNQYSTTLLHYECTSKELYWNVFGKTNWFEGYEQMEKCPKVDFGGWEDDSYIEKIWD